MRLTVVGCSGSMPGPDSPASCYLLEADDLAPDRDPAQSLAGAAGAFGGPVSLAAPGQVLDLG
jgi:hypothetical protein